MPYGLLADLVVLIHLVFVLFVLFGGLLILRWRRLSWVHLPAAAWGALVEFGGWVCPLTPLENHLRELGGDNGYRSDFVAQYLLPTLYPENLTRDAQVLFGAGVLVVNAVVYGYLYRRTLKGGG
jgi:hypothetical protein